MVDRTLPDGTVFQAQPKLRYPEELLAERVAELEAEIAHLRDDCEDGCVHCAAYVAEYQAAPGPDSMGVGIVSPSVNLDVVRTDNPSVGLVFKLSEGGTTYPVHSITMIGSSDE